MGKKSKEAGKAKESPPAEAPPSQRERAPAQREDFIDISGMNDEVFEKLIEMVDADVVWRGDYPDFVEGWGQVQDDKKGGRYVLIEYLREGDNRMPRTVNGTGHTGPSEFCATSI